MKYEELNHDKLTEKGRKELKKTIEELSKEYGLEFQETPDIVSVTIHSEGNEKTYSFTKIGDEMIVLGLGEKIHFSDIVKAKIVSVKTGEDYIELLKGYQKEREERKENNNSK